jgi:hypothetical protein
MLHQKSTFQESSFCHLWSVLFRHACEGRHLALEGQGPPEDLHEAAGEVNSIPDEGFGLRKGEPCRLAEEGEGRPTKLSAATIILI